MTRPVAEIVRERLLPLCSYDGDSVDTWLTAPHPALVGATPQELIDAGEGEVVLRLADHIASGAPDFSTTSRQPEKRGVGDLPTPAAPIDMSYAATNSR